MCEKKLSKQLSKPCGLQGTNKKVIVCNISKNIYLFFYYTLANGQLIHMIWFQQASTTTYATNSALATMLSAVMTTAGFTSAQEREAISNTVWFLSERNDNFTPDLEDSEELVCPSNDNINLKKGTLVA